MFGRLQTWLAANPGWSALAAAALVAVTYFVNSSSGIAPVQFRWLATIGITIVGLALIGAAVNGRPAGVLIDNRNRVSLSKFQAAAWTVLVVSAMVTAASLAPQTGKATAFEGIVLQPDLLIAMGISTISLVATPMLLSLKSEQVPAPDAVAATAGKLKLSLDAVQNVGKVFARSSPSLASWADMFRGDEAGNAGDADLSKVQQFLITLLLIGVYASSIWSRFGNSSPQIFPAFPPYFAWLMGISHASYLAYKAAPHTATAPAEAGADPASEAVG